MTHYDHAVLLAFELDVWDQTGKTHPLGKFPTTRKPLKHVAVLKKLKGYLAATIVSERVENPSTVSKLACPDPNSAKAC